MLKITKIKPMFTDIIITAERFDRDIVEKGIVVANKGDLKSYQTVIAVGDSIRNISVGDKVMVNFEVFAEHKIPVNSVKKDMDVNDPIVRYNIPWVNMTDADGNNKVYIRIPDRAVEFVFEGEEVDTPDIIQVGTPEILLN